MKWQTKYFLQKTQNKIFSGNNEKNIYMKLVQLFQIRNEIEKRVFFTKN